MNVTKWFKTPLKISEIFKQIQNKTFFIWIKHKNFFPIKFTTNKMAYFDKKKLFKKNKCLKCFWQQLTYDANKIVHKNHSNNNKLPCKTAVFGVFFIKMFNLFFSPNKNKVSSFCWIGFAWISSCKMNIERICYTFYFDLR